MMDKILRRDDMADLAGPLATKERYFEGYLLGLTDSGIRELLNIALSSSVIRGGQDNSQPSQMCAFLRTVGIWG